MPKAMDKTELDTREEEEIIEIEGEEPNIEAGTHGIINPIEARHHTQCLNEALKEMMTRLEGGEIKDVLKSLLEEFKTTIAIVMPTMVEANVTTVLRAIKDPSCLMLWPQTEEVEGLLEEFMPTEDIPSGSSVARTVGEV